MKLAFALFAILLTASCARPKPASLPPPPPPYDSVDCDNANGNPKLCTVEPDEPPPQPKKRSYPKLTPPRPGDMLVKNCSVMGQPSDVPNGKTDCICRKASTVIDAKDAGKPHSLICK